MVAFLNIKIPVDKDNPTFMGKSDDYPLQVVPKAIRAILDEAVKSAGPLVAQTFFEMTLTQMAVDMAKGLTVVGSKIILQLLALRYPDTSVLNVQKLIGLRNSYQNRKPIGLSLLWAISQAGRKNLTIGLSVWSEVMAPLLDIKNYSNYVAQILYNLVFAHDKYQDASTDLYFSIFETVYSDKINVPPQTEQLLQSSVARLRVSCNLTDISYCKVFIFK